MQDAEHPPVVVVAGLFPTYHAYVKRALLGMNLTAVIVSGVREEFLDDALKRVQRQGGYVLSGREGVARRVKELLSNPCHDASPPLSTFRAFDGKERGKLDTMTWLRENGLSEHAVERFDATNVSNVPLPVVLKPAIGSGGHGVHVVKSRKTLARLIGRRGGRAHVLEELVHNHTEWGMHFTAHAGIPLRTACVRMTFQDAVFVRSRRARTVRSIVWQQCPRELQTLGARLIARSNYTGFGCAGVKYVSDVPRVIEINPRVCGMFVKRDLFSEHLRNLSARMEAACAAHIRLSDKM